MSPWLPVRVERAVERLAVARRMYVVDVIAAPGSRVGIVAVGAGLPAARVPLVALAVEGILGDPRKVDLLLRLLGLRAGPCRLRRGGRRHPASLRVGRARRVDAVVDLGVQ